MRAAELKENIDWTVVFGEFGGMFRDVLEPALKDVREYMTTDEFKNSDAQSQKAIVDAMQQMESALGSATPVSFEQLGEEINKYREAMAGLREAQEDYRNKFDSLTKAQDNYEKAMATGTAAEQNAARGALAAAEFVAEGARRNLNTAQQNVEQTKDAVSTTATGLKTAMDNVVGGLQKLASGSVSGAFEGVKDLSKGISSLEKAPKALKDAMGKISEKLESVPIIGWIAQIIDLFKDGISVVITGLLDAVFSAVSGIIGDVLNFKDGLFRQIGESLVTGIMSIFESIFTLGGWFDWIGNGESNPHYEENMEKLTAANEALRNAIENLTDEMSDASVLDAPELYQQQKQFLEQSIANTREQMGQSLSAHKGGLGGKHSSAYFVNDNVSAGDWSQISRILGGGKSIGNIWDFVGLSPEEMAKVANSAPEIYARIKDLADDGYKNAAQYMDIFVGYAKEADELEDAFREKMTGISFDSLRSSFKSALSDMSKSAADFADDFNNLLVESMSEALMSNKYDEKIKELYRHWSSYMETGDGLDDSEIAQLQAERDRIFAEMQTDREALAALSGGTSSTRSGKSRFATASQDSIDELNGRFTALQIAAESIRGDAAARTSVVTSMLGYLQSIHVLTSTHSDRQDGTLTAMKDMLFLSTSYLEDIAANSRHLATMSADLSGLYRIVKQI